MMMLDLKDLVKDFGGLRAVDSLNLSIEQGQILGLIGPNGAGKSTVFNCIAGVYPPTEGEIFFDGTRINNVKPWDLCRQGLARTFQIVKPFASKTVLYNVMVGSYVTTDKRSAAESKAVETLKALNLYEKKDVKAGNLTIADRKRLEIARAWPRTPNCCSSTRSWPVSGRRKWTKWSRSSKGCATVVSPSSSSNTSCARSWPYPTELWSSISDRRFPRASPRKWLRTRK